MNVYLDHAATTPIHPEVRLAMLPYLEDSFGNPSSIHSFGRRARHAIDHARDQVANGLNTKANHIVFTSGGTEADNLAVMGVAQAERSNGKNHIITTQIEHHAVLDTCRYLETLGYEITYLPVDRTGRMDLNDLKTAITERTALISIMYGNNEVGTLQPIREIGELAKEKGIIFHTDAVQALGVKKLDVNDLPVDLLTITGHKINGPKGIGALYIKDNLKIIPRTFGGSQERRKRPGTENILGIIGLGQAVEIAVKNQEQNEQRLDELRNHFLQALDIHHIQYVMNGNRELTLPHILNISFPGMDTETLLMNLDMVGIACSSGSACTSGTLEVSHVLEAMNLSKQITKSAVRFSLGLGTKTAEIDYTVQQIQRIMNRLQGN
ncbi:cysteine desulfurase [Hazenella sp. IB182353]|uniref:IscS subfamily cysteine desulfurase n=1 Tax=Polycladospora coralii TaxID=2771432 RepID=UPI0017479C87|nr:cysteine desulfurase [Polycladospora coralii]